MKKVIVFYGWVDILHSYAIVNVCQTLAFIKKYHQEYDIYVDSSFPYYFKKWQGNKDWPKMWGGVCADIKTWILPRMIHGGWRYLPRVDVLYQIGFPYILQKTHSVGKYVVFYTSEDTCFQNISEYIPGYTKLSQVMDLNITWVTPSEWSAHNIPSTHVIPHGVMSELFYKDDALRALFRTRYDVGDAFVLLNISAMCGNKNIRMVIKTLYHLVQQGHHVKLVLKGSEQLYESKQFFQADLKLTGLDTSQLKELSQHIIFINTMLDMPTLNGLYNMCDAYISPYMMEGFNMPVLEAYSLGKKIIVTQGGPTDEFLNQDNVFYIPSELVGEKGKRRSVLMTKEKDVVDATLRAIRTPLVQVCPRVLNYDEIATRINILISE